MNYIEYKDGRFVATGKRPGNQNTPEVLAKIKRRLEDYFIEPDFVIDEMGNKIYFYTLSKEEKKKYRATKVQALFMEICDETGHYVEEGHGLKDKGIDTAHNVAISSIIQVFVDGLNQPETLNLIRFVRFAKAINSTGNTRGIDEFTRLWLKVINKDLRPELARDRANKIIDNLNMASRNLMPGWASSNRGISNNRDPHLLGEGDGYTEPPKAREIADSFTALKPGYGPRTYHEDGVWKIASSSADNGWVVTVDTPSAEVSASGEASTTSPEPKIVKYSDTEPVRSITRQMARQLAKTQQLSTSSGAETVASVNPGSPISGIKRKRAGNAAVAETQRRSRRRMGLEPVEASTSKVSTSLVFANAGAGAGADVADYVAE